MEESNRFDDRRLNYGPFWWNQKGRKMQLETSSGDKVVISGPAAKVTVFQDPIPQPTWKVSWWMDVFTSGEVSGWIWLTEEELKACFGLSNYCTSYNPEASLALQGQLGAQVVCAGKFVRTGRFLTLPNVTLPIGVGIPDYNVSLRLDDEVCQAVEALITRQQSGVH